MLLLKQGLIQLKLASNQPGGSIPRLLIVNPSLAPKISGNWNHSVGVTAKCVTLTAKVRELWFETQLHCSDLCLHLKGKQRPVHNVEAQGVRRQVWEPVGEGRSRALCLMLDATGCMKLY